MLRVMYFSILKEKVGLKEEEIDFKGPVGKLKEVLKERHPEIGDLLDRVRFAVNEEYVGEDHYLEGNEKVALIPPVSGG